MKHPEGKEKQGINLIYEYNYFFRKRMEKLFLGFYDRYSSVVKENMLSNGKRMKVSKSLPLSSLHVVTVLKTSHALCRGK